LPKFKDFKVSLTLRHVEAKDEEEARAEFYRLVSMGAYDSDLVEVEKEVGDEPFKAVGLADAKRRARRI
jgi:hypothetical protein